MNTLEQIWKIRDSRGLDGFEKSFLVVVASRGEAGCFCEWKRNKDDMGMGKDAYYARRDSLLDKGLITAEKQPYGPTLYRINDAELIAWHSATQNSDSATQNERSVRQNERSVRPERKSNTKNNKKTNSKKNNSRVEDAPSSGKPSLSSVKNTKDKERAVEEDSPIDLNVEESLGSSPIVLGEPEPEPDLILSNGDAHSVRQNEDKARAKAEAAIREVQDDPTSNREPLSEEEISKAVDLVLDLGFQRRVRGVKERAERAVWELQPLEW